MRASLHSASDHLQTLAPMPAPPHSASDDAPTLAPVHSASDDALTLAPMGASPHSTVDDAPTLTPLRAPLHSASDDEPPPPLRAPLHSASDDQPPTGRPCAQRRSPCSRAFALALTLGALTAFAQDAVDAGAPAGRCALDVEVKGLKDGGMVWVLLFGEAQAKAYPTKRDQALARVDVAPKGGVATARFEALTCGEYAVAVVHDEDGDGKLRTNFLGIPNEGLGASRNAKGTFGPPKFDAAKVRLSAGRTALPIDIDY